MPCGDAPDILWVDIDMICRYARYLVMGYLIPCGNTPDII
jgi:hypothetical protein